SWISPYECGTQAEVLAGSMTAVYSNSPSVSGPCDCSERSCSGTGCAVGRTPSCRISHQNTPANTATIRSPVTCKSLAPRPPATRTGPGCSRTAPEAAGAVRDIAAIPPVSVRRWVPDTPGDTSGPVSSRLYRLPPRPCAQHHRGHTQFSGGTVPGKHVGASPCRVRGRVTHRQPTARVTEIGRAHVC